MTDSASTSTSAASAVHALIGHAATIAVAESLTGGLVCAALTSVPGASSVVRGAIVAYATELKADLLRVDAALLEREGAVHPEVAAQMAHGVRVRLGADVGVGTTGVAGPEPQDGKPVGEVHIAVSTATSLEVRSLNVDAELGRAGIRAATVEAVLVLLEQVLSTYTAPDGSE
jgi:nicotinamide-nucleotide amidase